MVTKFKNFLISRITLFDSPEDDEFDGEIGEHDDETPRVLLNFRIENFPSPAQTRSPRYQDEKPPVKTPLQQPITNPFLTSSTKKPDTQPE